VVGLRRSCNESLLRIRGGAFCASFVAAHRASRLAFDDSGNLYVSNSPNFYDHASVTVYSPGKFQLIRTIRQGIMGSITLALDKEGELYVANFLGGPQHTGSVVVYLRGESKPSRTITSGIKLPDSMLVDQSGHLYVANSKACAPICSHGSVSVYRGKDTRVFREITDAVNNAGALALGPKP
jgi:sugar lactone lactonase YvrE